MKGDWFSWPRRFLRWLLSSPFQSMPPLFGNTAPLDWQAFKAQAEEAKRCGLGGVAAQAPMPHRKSRPARWDSALERQ